MTATAEVARTTTWSEVPGSPPRRGHPVLLRIVSELVCFTVALAPSLMRSDTRPGSDLRFTAITIVVTTAALAFVPARWWLLRHAVILAGALVLAGAEGEYVAAYAAAGMALGDWGARRRSPLPFLPTPSVAAMVPVLVLSLVSGSEARPRTAHLEPFVILALAGVAVLVDSLFGDILGRIARRFGRAVAGALSFVLVTALGIVVVAVPWGVQRITRVDPLDSPTPPGSGWIPLRRRDRRPVSPWVTDASPLRWSGEQRVRRVAAAVLGFAVVSGTITAAQGQGGTSPATAPRRGFSLANNPVRPTTDATMPDPANDRTPLAYRRASWWRRYNRDINWVISQRNAWRPIHPERIKDVQTPTVNVRDGARVSWKPPECSCRRLRVWIYGGSTTFGIGQRDEHTIPSELARAAWEEGIALDVVNRGQPADLHWQEGQRFAWDITRRDAPDLVLFYDGVNDFWATQLLVDKGLGDSTQPMAPLMEGLWEGWNQDAPPSPPRPPGDAVLPTTTIAPMNQEEIGELTVRRYDRSRGIASAAAAAKDVPVEFFWQPTRVSRTPIRGEYPDGEPNDAELVKKETAARKVLPDDVHDLSDVFDGNTRPLFSDDVHHNEEGARIVAAAMLDVLRPRLATLLEAAD